MFHVSKGYFNTQSICNNSYLEAILSDKLSCRIFKKLTYFLFYDLPSFDSEKVVCKISSRYMCENSVIECSELQEYWIKVIYLSLARDEYFSIYLVKSDKISSKMIFSEFKVHVIETHILSFFV